MESALAILRGCSPVTASVTAASVKTECNFPTKGGNGVCPATSSRRHQRSAVVPSELVSFPMRPSSFPQLSGASRGQSTQVSIHESHPAHVRDVKVPLELDPERLPRHVAIILDGNNRWAKEMGVTGREGLDCGLSNLAEIVQTCDELGIEILTLFQFAYDNWKRSKEEVDTLFDLFELHLAKNRDAIKRRNIQFSVIGEVHRFPERFLNLVRQVEEESRGNTGLKVVIAGGYSGQRDIVFACKRIAALVSEKALEVEDINEETVQSQLMTNHLPYPNPDLMIRTSGEQRISNFLLWQLAFCELMFVPEKWPAFKPDNFKSALVSFQSRDRRFGARKVKF